ncbi:hypothetical protein BD413DRAFT_278440 [Trametes elegans]|nr:hypothetical protein BD413DRAFT_278440 [Trametes elegans]
MLTPRPHRAVNVDIFRPILALLPRGDLLRLSCTCHFLRDEASEAILAQPVSIIGHEQLASFCEFVLAGDSRRTSCVRRLDIFHIQKSLGGKLQDALLRFLESNLNLEQLSIVQSDALFKDDARISAAISSLRGITHLVVRHGWPGGISISLACQAVITMRSPLRSLKFELMDDPAGDTFLQDLAHAHTGLEELVLRFFRFNASYTPFHSVRKLHLEVEEYLPALRDLYTSFPAVQELAVCSQSYVAVRITEDLVVRARHDASADHEKGNAWPELHALRASAKEIDVLGLSCPVRLLDLKSILLYLSARVLDMLSSLRPRKLTLRLDYPRGGIAGLCMPELYGPALQSVRYLYAKVSPVSHTADIVSSLRNIVAAARIEVLHVVIAQGFSPTSQDADEFYVPAMDRPPSVYVADFMQLVNIEAVARELAGLCESLQTVAITFLQAIQRIWRVTRTRGGEINMELLEPHVGRGLLERETRRCLQERAT